MKSPQSAVAGGRPLRILEIGNHELFVHAVPQQTEFYWTGLKPRGRAARVFGPLQMIRSLRKLRRGEFDLLVVHASQYAPWHPRSFLTVLRDWHIRAPLGLFAIFAWRFVHQFHGVPIVAVDLGDPCIIGAHNFFLLDRCCAFFKRELPSDHWLVFCRSGYPNFPGRRWRSKEHYRQRIGKLKPISLGLPPPPRVSLAAEKQADVFFAGTIESNSTVRTAGLRELKTLASEGYAVDVASERLQQPAFLQRMSAAWLAWSPGGLGWDCSRHYEAPLAGTVPLMNDPTILRHQPLQAGEHCVLYPVEPGGLAEAARRALADKPRLRKMAQAAAAHVREHHSFAARAEYVTSTVLGRRLDGSRIEPAEPVASGEEAANVKSPAGSLAT